MSDQKLWKPEQQEARVERFYGTGTDGYHEYHGGYLNFGYWTRPRMAYREAAENLVQTMADILGLNTTSQMLDVGCGMGTQDLYLAQCVGVRSIDALDVTWKHVMRARQRSANAGIPETRLRFHHGTAIELPFPDATFTHVLSIEAPEHFDTREQFYREAFRVLKPGGVLACCDYSLNREPRHTLDRLVVEWARRLWQVPRANVYGASTFEKKLCGAGFTNISLQDVSQQTIPGYFFECRRPKNMREIAKIRGLLKGVIGGFFVDLSVYAAFAARLCSYIFVRAEKPMA